MPVITIASLVRNRDWILSDFLKHLYNIKYDKKKIILHFVINNSTDQSEVLIREFKKKYDKEYLRIKIDVLNKGGLEEDTRVGNTRFRVIYTRLSELRNYIFDKCNTDYLLNIDSDILVSEDILEKLLEHKKDMVSSFIWNGYHVSEKDYFRFSNIMKYVGNICIEENGKVFYGDPKFRAYGKKEIEKFKEKGVRLLEVGLTGAACLYSKKIIKDKRVRFGFDCNGEDHFFCIKAKQNNYKIYTDLECYSQHIMDKDWYKKYKLGVDIS